MTLLHEPPGKMDQLKLRPAVVEAMEQEQQSQRGTIRGYRHRARIGRAAAL